MTTPTRSEVAAVQRELRRDARLEWRVLLKAGGALVLVTVAVLLRELAL
ncbi:MAG TPA: hypothetical protein VNQ48_04405 [Microbacteriaceae bacterium]|nr:hypothetical protein [Microbacteriaceae bacterium]